MARSLIPFTLCALLLPLLLNGCAQEQSARHGSHSATPPPTPRIQVWAQDGLLHIRAEHPEAAEGTWQQSHDNDRTPWIALRAVLDQWFEAAHHSEQGIQIGSQPLVLALHPDLSYRQAGEIIMLAADIIDPASGVPHQGQRHFITFHLLNYDDRLLPLVLPLGPSTTPSESATGS